MFHLECVEAGPAAPLLPEPAGGPHQVRAQEERPAHLRHQRPEEVAAHQDLRLQLRAGRVPEPEPRPGPVPGGRQDEQGPGRGPGLAPRAGGGGGQRLRGDGGRRRDVHRPGLPGGQLLEDPAQQLLHPAARRAGAVPRHLLLRPAGAVQPDPERRCEHGLPDEGRVRGRVRGLTGPRGGARPGGAPRCRARVASNNLLARDSSRSIIDHTPPLSPLAAPACHPP
mmetsp:Transcript_124343/g.352015  ORF Transcript_124343/g.352015 Transcript_124343/m.352015 type:complete len:225 (-) Transcript_124343:1079-1753(-)